MLKLPKQIKMGREKPLIEPLQVDTHKHLTPPNPKSSQQELLGFVNRGIGPCTEDQDYIEKIKQLQAYLDMVKKIVKPGCSQEVLKVALSSMTSLVNILSSMSSTPKFHACL